MMILQMTLSGSIAICTIDAAWALGIEPDLLLAENEEGVTGYVRQRELDGAQPTTPAEAITYQSDAPFDVNLYLQDGVTVVGTFEVSSSEAVSDYE